MADAATPTAPTTDDGGKKKKKDTHPRDPAREVVLKPLFHLRRPERGDGVVFKFPESPQLLHTAQNYIKRAMGFGGETVAIWRGELFVTRALEFPREEGVDELDLWKPQYMHA